MIRFKYITRELAPSRPRIAREGIVSESIRLKTGELVAFREGGRKYRVGTVLSSALRNGSDPIMELDRARARGEELAFLTPQASALTSTPLPTELVVLLDKSQPVEVEGRVYRIGRSPHGDIELQRITAGEPATADFDARR
jgi:hypothetical protein